MVIFSLLESRYSRTRVKLIELVLNFMSRKLSRRQKDEQIMSAIYHYLDHKLLYKSEADSEASLENHDVANVALTYATLLSQERLGRTNLFVSFMALALSFASIMISLRSQTSGPPFQP